VIVKTNLRNENEKKNEIEIKKKIEGNKGS
jgi:hypothetical protein